MRVFLDANILVSVLNKEYPLFSFSSRVMSLADDKRFTLATSPVCLSIAFYFAEKKCGTKLAKAKIAILASKIAVTPVGEKEILSSLQNKKVHDFEDGVEYYAALHNKCSAIITEDTKDFYFSDIETMNCKTFLEKYLFPPRK